VSTTGLNQLENHFSWGSPRVNSCVTASSYSLRAKSTLERNGQSSFQKCHIRWCFFYL